MNFELIRFYYFRTRCSIELIIWVFDRSLMPWFMLLMLLLIVIMTYLLFSIFATKLAFISFPILIVPLIFFCFLSLWVLIWYLILLWLWINISLVNVFTISLILTLYWLELVDLKMSFHHHAINVKPLGINSWWVLHSLSK